MALSVLRGRHGGRVMGTRRRRRGVERHATVPSQRRTVSAGADARQRDHGAGAMVSMMLNQPEDPRDAQIPLRFISAAPISADLYPRIEQRYGVRIVTMYGM